jgi:hypothetical protein
MLPMDAHAQPSTDPVPPALVCLLIAVWIGFFSPVKFQIALFRRKPEVGELQA